LSKQWNTEAVRVSRLGAVSGAHDTVYDVSSVFVTVHSRPYCCYVHDRHVQQTQK
jgi:hypothetical protein